MDVLGSSPLTRGKQPYYLTGETFQRLIPAHAGKTHGSSSTPPPPRAHPRSRGENSRGGARGGRATGSSPLTRGKLNILDTDRPERRLIPAHAGKTRR